MSTFINVTGGGDDLVDRIKAQQQAGRLTKAEQDRLDSLADKKKKQEQKSTEQQKEGKGLDPLPYERDKGAHRYAQGSMAAAECKTISSRGELVISVGPPGQPNYAQARVADPNAASPVWDGSSHESPINTQYQAKLGRYWIDGTAWYWRSYSTGSWLLLPAEPPDASVYEISRETYTVQQADKSRWFLLPAGKGTCVAIYIQNVLKAYNVFSLRDTLNRQSEYKGQLYPGGTNYPIYNRYETEDIVWTFKETQIHAARNVFAFAVSKTKARVLSVPATLGTKLLQLFPAVALNSTSPTPATYHSKVLDRDGLAGPDRIVIEPGVYTYTTQPAFDLTTYQQGTVYGIHPEQNETLAIQYGIGDLASGDHTGNFYSPAVYSYLAGTMNLKPPEGIEYQHVRSNSFSNAPSKYLGLCARTGGCTTGLAEFDATRQMPQDIYTDMPPGAFAKESRYDVPLNGSARSGLHYAWDWDKPDYCRQQLLSLGFTPSDLIP